MSKTSHTESKTKKLTESAKPPVTETRECETPEEKDKRVFKILYDNILFVGEPSETHDAVSYLIKRVGELRAEREAIKRKYDDLVEVNKIIEGARTIANSERDEAKKEIERLNLLVKHWYHTLGERQEALVKEQQKWEVLKKKIKELPSSSQWGKSSGNIMRSAILRLIERVQKGGEE